MHWRYIPFAVNGKALQIYAIAEILVSAGNQSRTNEITILKPNPGIEIPGFT
jgi:hypothetical protein